MKDRLLASAKTVMPIVAIVLLLSITILPMSVGNMLLFIVGACFLVIGMSLFDAGAEMSMQRLGAKVGSAVSSTGKLWLISFISFIIGIMVTVSEPDLQILAGQVADVENMLLILTVSVGVGVFLMIAVLRIFFRIPLAPILVVFYLITFVLSFFLHPAFRPLAFDSGGVTTGPMTVPFIMALGVGVASIRSDDGGGNDSFGLVALCSVGPIIAVMILGLIYGNGEIQPSTYTISAVNDSRGIFAEFLIALPHYMKEVAMAVGPIVVFFLIFRALSGGRGMKELGKILIGVAYTYVGLVIFLVGVNIGFMPLGNYLGKTLAASPYKWVIVPLGMLIGYFIVAAEPAVHVLTKQVEKETSGAIPGRVLSLALSLGVALSVGIAMLRVLTGIPVLYILIPGYAIALVLSFFVPDLFTSIAFDSGGVASGPMTATFLLPFAVGACTAVGGNVVEDAFGVVAMVAMTPLIAIQILGLVFKIKQARAARASFAETASEEAPIELDANTSPVSDGESTPSDDDIIEL